MLSLLLMLGAAYSYKRYMGIKALGAVNVNYTIVSMIVVVVISVAMGLRDNVGTDWENYKYIFESYSPKYFTTFGRAMANERIEPLYSLLNFIVISLGGSYQLFLTIIMGIHLVMLLYACKTFPRYSILIVYFYFMVLFLSTLNIHRQTLAICIFLFALHFLLNKQIGKYYIACIIACLFHYSSVIVLLVPILATKAFRFMDNKYVCLVLYVLGFYLGQFLTDMIITYIPLLTDNAKYNSNLQQLEHVHEYSSGLGLLFYKVLDLVLIWNIPKFVSNGVSIYTRTFVAGIVLSNAFANSMFLARVALPFTSVKIFLLSFLLADCFKDEKLTLRKTLALLVIAVAFLGFLMNIANHNSGCSPFQFI